MALTYTNYAWQQGALASGGDVTSTSRSYTSGDLVLVGYSGANNQDIGNLTISNSGTAQTWTNVATTNTTENCKIGVWFCVMSTTQSMTVSVNGDDVGTTAYGFISITAIQGQHATTPVPAGNRFSGVGAANVSQSITPTASGSQLWLFAGDWNAANVLTGGTNCSLEGSRSHLTNQQTAALIRPTTQPRSDASAFTIASAGAGQKIAWCALEIQAAAGGAPTALPRRALDGPFHGSLMGSVR